MYSVTCMQVLYQYIVITRQLMEFSYILVGLLASAFYNSYKTEYYLKIDLLENTPW